MILVASLSLSMMLAKLVRGPFVSTVILSLGRTDFDMVCQTSRAKACLNAGQSVSLGAPNFTEFSAVYLKK